ncbi:MAG: MBL fold metallo-hydrolase [Bacteroidetes bacterium]|nr:MBL fold metallo-hydrolase [Bacteroidota bacterium]MBP6426945.1 MBL fold metallo-hydrolase [Bacteroidia bacterium]MBP6658284.1 MBL fold metallo-hydrolase [Bacteroidia bacterium]
MNLFTINTGFFKLDGGAMFGVVPKSMWKKINPPDENNMCNWAMRCLLVEDGDRLILIDNGIGNKQDDKFFGYYFLNGDDTLSKSLTTLGFHEDDITDMFLTHLHFDHCGGSIKWNSAKDKLEPAFKNATYWSNEKHWEWATKPNPREKASFLKENILPIQESGQLKFINDGDKLTDNFKVRTVSGHTESMMLPIIDYKGKKIAYCADLIPSAGHTPVPYVMAYDTRPLLSLQEKTDFLNDAVKENYVLFFEHDPVNECGIMEMTERGPKLKETLPLSGI